MNEEKKGWPLYVKVPLFLALVAFVAAYAVGQVNLRERGEEVAALNARHTVDSLLIVQLTNMPPDTVVEVRTVTDTVTRWRSEMVVDTVVVIEDAPPCFVCRPRVDTLFVDVLQVDTLVHEIEVVTVVAKRNWWEYVIVSGLSFGAGYLVGDSDRPEQICVQESEGFCQ